VDYKLTSPEYDTNDTKLMKLEVSAV